MLELEDALGRLLATIQPLLDESVETSRAAERILAENIKAPINLPSFDNSAMDGYAVVAKDIQAASPSHPTTLRLISRVAAGEPASQALQTGQCIRIFTGSPIPNGANAVIMQEDTRVAEGSDATSIEICDTVKPWENIRLKGEDIKESTPLFTSGQRLNAASLALLGAMGIRSLQVHRRPVVGILATGSELLEPGQPLTPGKIYESNRILIADLARKAGAEPKVYPIVHDTLEETKRAVSNALQECDAVVTSGGVSVGELDFVKEAFASLGGELNFWKVAIRPGKPFVFGQIQNKYWFGLPGNPISALVTFILLARPAILKMQGSGNLHLMSLPGKLNHALENRGDRRHFMRVKIGQDGEVASTGTQASHMLSSIVTANGLVDVPPRSQLAPGTPVHVLLWDV